MLEKNHTAPISIDFVAGSHGNFLEYVCNKFLADINIDFEPFNRLGSSHNKNVDYTKQRLFHAWHWSEYNQPCAPRVIRILFDPDDLLLLSSISLLRAGDMNIDNDQLHVDTYNKLNNLFYNHVIDSLNTAYPFLNLSEENPHCPRFVLREYFKFGFKDPTQHGLFVNQNKMHRYNQDYKLFDFCFKSFYDIQSFMTSMQQLSNWTQMPLKNVDQLKILHHEFLKKQIYKNHKYQADQIIQAVIQKQSMDIFDLTLLQESYINGVLELNYQIEMPYEQHRYFANALEISAHLGL